MLPTVSVRCRGLWEDSSSQSKGPVAAWQAIRCCTFSQVSSEGMKVVQIPAHCHTVCHCSLKHNINLIWFAVLTYSGITAYPAPLFDLPAMCTLTPFYRPLPARYIPDIIRPLPFDVLTQPRLCICQGAYVVLGAVAPTDAHVNERDTGALALQPLGSSSWCTEMFATKDIYPEHSSMPLASHHRFVRDYSDIHSYSLSRGADRSDALPGHCSRVGH